MLVSRSWMDTFAFAEKCKEAEEYLENKGVLAFWSSRRSGWLHMCLPYMIFLFLVILFGVHCYLKD